MCRMHKITPATGGFARIIRVLTLCIALVTAAAPAQAVSGVAQLCDDAARSAARDSEVPLAILRAITRVETGRQGRDGLVPWPWAVNMAGRGHWFESEAEAWRFVYDAFRDGQRDFDVGCFQINYRWHGAHFPSIEAMFDPFANARYAARFLTELYAETGSWDDAVRAYHSRTPDLADLYAARFEDVLAAMEGGDASLTGRQAALFPTDGTAGPGSLVRLSTAGAGGLSLLTRQGEP